MILKNTMKIFLFAILWLPLFSCNIFEDKDASDAGVKGKKRDLPKNMHYDYDCLHAEDSSQFREILSKADKIINAVATFDIEVTDEEQMLYGDSFLVESLKDKNFLIDSTSPILPKLNRILAELVAQRASPSGIKYSIYLLEDTANVNAYTIGGKIFITQGILNRCKNDDQLYAIIGHEIGHNEKGHLKNIMKQIKASNKLFGEWGEPLVAIKRLLTGSFNQKNELEADYYGLDLSWKLGYDVCSIIEFWDVLSQQEQRDDAFFDFFRTHPYSDTRSQCLANHIEKNFSVSCP